MNFIGDTFRNETAAIDLLATRFNDYLWPARKEEYMQYSTMVWNGRGNNIICLVCFGEKEREGRVIKTVIHIGISRCFRLSIREHYSNGAQKIQTDGKCSGKRAFL